MNILFHNYYEELNNDNRLFEQDNAVIGDNLLRPFQVLREQALSQGVTVGTRAVIPIEKANAIVFIDLPDTSRTHVQQMINSGIPLYLIVFESILVRPVNKNDSFLNCFRKIFTYNDSMVDGERFLKINYSFDLPQKIDTDLSHKKKLCTMIAGNKRVRHPQELYSERLKAIRWFEKNHPDDFDLYGTGWEEYHFGEKLPVRVLNRFKPLKRLIAPRFPSYRGVIERKKPVLEQYKFAICYENVKDVPGYITEKIFDCFFAGCVPIYWGASNIDQYVPSDCFIDRNRFTTQKELYDYINDIDDSEYNLILQKINDYISSSKIMQFSTNCFSEIILYTIEKDN